MTPRRREVLLGLGALALTGCSTGEQRQPTFISPTDPVVSELERTRATQGGAVQKMSVTARPATVDLGGPIAKTWCYDDSVPGPVIRAVAGQQLQVDLRNDLPQDTTIHWHGLRLRNDMDGVPDVTQAPVGPGESFQYRFTLPDPGTYFFHSHVGLQLDRGMIGVLLIEDPDEPGDYDHDWVIVLDDWLDGVDGDPEQAMQRLRDSAGGGRSMGGMMGGGLDLQYPHYLVNGRVPNAAQTLQAKPGQRARLRVINAASDTTFRCALAGHRLTVTHKDGVPTAPTETDAVLVSMGERYDAVVELGDGAFPFVAVPEGKPGYARTVIRTSESAATPAIDLRPSELTGKVLFATEIAGPEQTPGYDLGDGAVDQEIDITLNVGSGYTWLLNGTAFAESDPYPIEQGQRVRLTMTNRSHALHPMHLHGHSFRVGERGSFQDTVLVGPMNRVSVDFRADNPGMWAYHCHNAFHAETGMMALFGYQT